MTELEFQNTDPTKYNEGNCNLLYSSSISTGSFALPSNYPTGSTSPSESGGVYYLPDAFFPPYTILGLTIPNNSENGVSVEQTLQNVKAVKFTFAGTVVSLEVLGISKRSNYFYLRTQPLKTNTFPEGRDQSNIPIISALEFIFTPFLKEKFSNSDYNALIGNVSIQKTSTGAVQVDRLVGQAAPSNYHALVSGSASPAAVQYSNYTISGLSNARYGGCKLQSGSVEGEDPAMGYRSFKGAINERDADNATILAQTEGKDIFFSVDRKPSVYFTSADTFNDYTGSTFPTPATGTFKGSIMYEEEGNRFIRIVNKKVHAIDRGSIFHTNELGRTKKETT